MHYKIISTDGCTDELVPAKKKPTLAEMQAIVGGFIERVRIPGGEMWVNEDGLAMKLSINLSASQLAGQRILGNVLVCLRKKRGDE